jgi:MATE family multidrug resistance protein
MNKEIVKLALPNILTNLTVPLVSIVDLGLMGRMPSASYIVAIGFGTLIFNFIYWAFGFLRMGTTGIVSQAYGAKNKQQVSDTLFRALLIAIVGGLLLILFQDPLLYVGLKLIAPDSAVMVPLTEYFSYRIYAAPATISVYVLTGCLLGMQDSRSVLIIALLVNLSNAIISYYLVHYVGLSIKGVALGTLIAQYLGLFLGLILMFKKHRAYLQGSIIVAITDWLEWRGFLLLNGNIFIRTMCLIAVMSLFKATAGNIDPLVGAANILLLEFITLAAYGIDGFAFAAESVCGKYFGERNRSAFQKAVLSSFKWGLVLGLIIALLYLLFGEQILWLMTDKEEVINQALTYLPWLVIAPIINAFAFIWDGVYIGTTASGTMRDTMLIATLIFLPVFYISLNYWGNHGLWFAFSVFMIARGLLQTILAKKAIYQRID